MNDLLSIIVPAYNEASFLRKSIIGIFDALKNSSFNYEIIIINDASDDKTGSIANELKEQYSGKISVLENNKNLGKGASIAKAVEIIKGNIVVFHDADLEYDPNDIIPLIQPILDGKCDVVYGSRFNVHGQRRVMNYHHSLANFFITHFSNFTTGLNLTDIGTCYKAFRADILKTIPLRSKRFGIEAELTAKVAKRDCIVYEIPINYYGRTYFEGKKINFIDAIDIILTIIKYWIIDDCYEERYGHSILFSLSRVHRLNRWMVDVVSKYFGNRILEIGSGMGNLSRFLPKKEILTVSDIDPVYVDLLEKAFCHYENVSTVKLDLNNEEDFKNPVLNKKYDTIFCLNVLEHIKDDVTALKRMNELLDKEGRIIILVPQFQFLMSKMDKFLEHYRRYNKKTLTNAFTLADFKVEKMIQFNSLGLLGWLINAKILGKTNLSRFQLKIFNSLVPILRIIEKILPLPGLSIIAIGVKNK